jgi:hypothetical protein
MSRQSVIRYVDSGDLHAVDMTVTPKKAHGKRAAKRTLRFTDDDVDRFIERRDRRDGFAGRGPAREKK